MQERAALQQMQQSSPDAPPRQSGCMPPPPPPPPSVSGASVDQNAPSNSEQRRLGPPGGAYQTRPNPETRMPTAKQNATTAGVDLESGCQPPETTPHFRTNAAASEDKSNVQLVAAEAGPIEAHLGGGAPAQMGPQTGAQPDEAQTSRGTLDIL